MIPDNELFHDISRNMYYQSERLLRYVAGHLKGQKVEIVFHNTGNSVLTNFIDGTDLRIQIDCNQLDQETYFEIGIYRINEKPTQNYEVSLYLNEETDIFRFIPKTLVDALKESIKTEDSLEIII